MAKRALAHPPLKAQAVAVVVALQAVAAAFFLGDVISDIRAEGFGPHVLTECLAVLALMAGVLFGAQNLQRHLAQSTRQREALAVASGALADLVQQRFQEWGLTEAERHVALLALKGFDGNEIAGLRGAAPGTVRAQLAHVYAKAGVNSRADLVCLFFDELLDGLPS